MENIKFLIKFVEKEEHADCLMDGKLFMYPAAYYRCLEDGRGDKHEGAISRTAMIYKGDTHPIYCMYTVCNSDIFGNYIKIDPKCIEDFKCKHGWAVIVEYNTFCKMIPSLEANQYAIWHGPVNYRELTMNDTQSLLMESSPRNLFYKLPKFAYQHEYRFVIGDSISPNLVRREMNGVCVDFLNETAPYNPTTYKFSKRLNEFAYKIPMRSLVTESSGVYLPLPGNLFQ